MILGKDENEKFENAFQKLSEIGEDLKKNNIKTNDLYEKYKENFEKIKDKLVIMKREPKNLFKI